MMGVALDDWTCQMEFAVKGLPGCGVMPQGISSPLDGISQLSGWPLGIWLTSRWSACFRKVLLARQLVRPGANEWTPIWLAIAKSPRVMPLVLRVNAEEPTNKKPPAAT